MNKCIDCGKTFNPLSPGASSCRGPFCNKKYSLLNNLKIPAYIETIANKIKQSNYPIFLVGGCVRDTLLQRKIKDYDLATSATPEELSSLFPEALEVGKSFGVLKVPIKNDQNELVDIVEIATFRKDGEYTDGRRPNSVVFSNDKEDALRRDFTINALFLDINSKQIIDHVGGLESLEKKEIKAVGNPIERFNEDPLRMLRAIRFGGSLNFDIEINTFKAICENKHLLSKVSAERIFDELNKIFSNNPNKGIELLNKTQLLSGIFPKLSHIRVSNAKDVPSIAYFKSLQEDSGLSIKEFSNKIRFTKNDLNMLEFLNTSGKLTNDYKKSSEELKNEFFSHPQGFSTMEKFLELRNEPFYFQISNDYKNYLKNPVNLSLIPSGETLQSLGYKPGPIFSQIQKQVKSELLSRRISTTYEVDLFVKNLKKTNI